MSWLFFKTDPEDRLLSKLSPQTRDYYKLQKREHESYHDKVTNTGFKASKEQLHQSSQVNCAEYQEQFMSCLTHGPLKERMLGCHEKQQQWDSCMSNQLKLFHQLGLQYVRDKEKYDQGVMVAYSLDGKYEDDEAVLKKRDELWEV